MKIHAKFLLSNLLLLRLSCAGTLIYQQSRLLTGPLLPTHFPVKFLTLQRGSIRKLSFTHTPDPQKFLSIFLLSFLIADSVLFWLLRSILLALKNIEQITQQFRAGDFNARIAPTPIAEVQQLELTFNGMAEQVQGMVERRQAFISDLIHEMASPAMLIQGYLQLLSSKSSVQLTVDIRRQLCQEAERMTRLIQDVQLLSRAEARRLPLQVQSFPPLSVMKWVMYSFKVKGWKNSCKLELQSPPALPNLFADPDRFNQILTNLIGNALAYTPRGSVRVIAWAEQSQVWIEVRDTGIGIAPEELPFVFDRFWRSPHSQHLRQEGSGIGLAITRQLVEAMGGQIEVQSTLGQGSTFRFSLPVSASVPIAMPSVQKVS